MYLAPKLVVHTPFFASSTAGSEVKSLVRVLASTCCRASSLLFTLVRTPVSVDHWLDVLTSRSARPTGVSKSCFGRE